MSNSGGDGSARRVDEDATEGIEVRFDGEGLRLKDVEKYRWLALAAEDDALLVGLELREDWKRRGWTKDDGEEVGRNGCDEAVRVRRAKLVSLLRSGQVSYEAKKIGR